MTAMYNMEMDLETSGLDIYHDEPVQIGYVIHQNGKRIQEDEFFLKINFPMTPGATERNHITNTMLQEKGISPEVGVKRWQAAIKKHQPMCLYGYNIINFDFPMLMNWINRYSLLKYKYPPLCQVTDLMLSLAAIIKGKWKKLGEAAEYFNIPLEKDQLHGALYDAQVTYKVRKAMETRGYLG